MIQFFHPGGAFSNPLTCLYAIQERALEIVIIGYQ
jgi:hypothetical protein